MRRTILSLAALSLGIIFTAQANTFVTHCPTVNQITYNKATHSWHVNTPEHPGLWVYWQEWSPSTKIHSFYAADLSNISTYIPLHCTYSSNGGIVMFMANLNMYTDNGMSGSWQWNGESTECKAKTADQCTFSITPMS